MEMKWNQRWFCFFFITCVNQLIANQCVGLIFSCFIFFYNRSTAFGSCISKRTQAKNPWTQLRANVFFSVVLTFANDLPHGLGITDDWAEHPRETAKETVVLLFGTGSNPWEIVAQLVSTLSLACWSFPVWVSESMLALLFVAIVKRPAAWPYLSYSHQAKLMNVIDCAQRNNTVPSADSLIS